MNSMVGWSSVPFPLLLRPLLLLLGTQLTLSTSRNLSSEPSAVNLSPGSRCGHDEYEYRSGRRCCQRCPAGQYVEEPCSSPHTRSKCEACDTGTYTGHANGLRSCLLCTTCREDQEMVSACTPTQDRRCQCKTGEFYCDSEHCLESCYRCTSCPGATLQTCNATRDTECAPAARPEPGPPAGSLAVSALVVSVVAPVAIVINIVVIAIAIGIAIAIARWRRRGVLLPQWLCRFRTATSGEPGSHESSVALVSSPEAPDADAPVPTTGAPHLPEDRLDVVSEPPILPGTPESPAGDGPRPGAEAGDEAGPQAGHHGLFLLHPPPSIPYTPFGGSMENRSSKEDSLPHAAAL